MIQPDEIVVESDVGVTELGMNVTVFALGASLNPSVVIGYSGSIIVDIVVLYVVNKLSWSVVSTSFSFLRS